MRIRITFRINFSTPTIKRTNMEINCNSNANPSSMEMDPTSTSPAMSRSPTVQGLKDYFAQLSSGGEGGFCGPLPPPELLGLGVLPLPVQGVSSLPDFDSVQNAALIDMANQGTMGDMGMGDASGLGLNFFIGGGGSGGGYGQGGGGGGSGRGGGGGGFGSDDPALTLASIGGLDGHIGYLKRNVMYAIKHQNALAKWGILPPKGIMFYGPPGTGKTMTAKALANEISSATGKEVSFFYHKGTQSFSKWFGESEANLRALFDQAVKSKPSVIFFDEIDGLCPNRDALSRSSQAYASVVTALLGLIDSVKRGDVFIIGATNRLDSVDPAIRRPGRFDRDLYFSLPSEQGRKAIITIHTSKWPRTKPTGPLLNELARRTVGFSGADLKKLCTDACRIALTRTENENDEEDVDEPEEVSVNEQDWVAAFTSMHRSNPNVYGSAVHIPDPVPEVLLPLIRTDVNAIVGAIDQTLISGKELGSYDSNYSFLVRAHLPPPDPCDKHQLDTIMQAVLDHPKLRSYTVTKLDSATIIKGVQEGMGKGDTPLKVVNDIIDRTTNSIQTKILYIPLIDELHEILFRLTNDPSSNWFNTKLNGIKGANNIILATWTGKHEQFPELRKLFLSHRVYTVPHFQTSQRKKFFHQILKEENSTPKPKSKNKDKGKAAKPVVISMEKLLERCVNATENESMDTISNLFSKLSKILKTSQQGGGTENFEGMVEKAISDFETNAPGGRTP